MRNLVTTAVLVGVLALPVATFGSTPAKAQAHAAAGRPAKAVEAGHATTGVVKSVGATKLVIARSGKKAGEMTFVLSPSTHREGTIEIGSSVSVRYVEDGAIHVATAITAEAKQRPARQASAKR